jgi:hypothetical protein
MVTATAGYTDEKKKRNESEHVHEQWWEVDRIGCPSLRHEEQCCKWSCDSAWLQRLGEKPLFTQFGTRFKNIDKGILSIQTNPRQYVVEVFGWMIIIGPSVRGSACACTSYHANCPAAGITNTQGRLKATQPVFPRLSYCILSFVHINGYRSPLWCSKIGLRTVWLYTCQTL